LSKEFGKFENRFCIGASPAQNLDAVFILVDHDGPSYLIAINKADGQDIWKKDRTSRISWSSPALLPIGGKQHLVVSSTGTIDGYDPTTGELLWSKDDVGGNTAPTPTSGGDGLVLIGASPGPRGESTEVASKSNFLLAVADEGEGYKASEVWKAGKAMSSFGSPIMYKGFGYWVNRAGVVFCFDMASGEQKFAERLDESCWATPVGIGDRVYFFGRTGKTTVIQAGPEFKKLATNTLWTSDDEEGSGGRPQFGGLTQYGIAVVDNALLVRTGQVLYCVKDTD
jgi:outer membrane protein assembly factor BamB